MTEYLTRLQDAIKHLHGCESVHLESVPIKETFREKTVWEGTVEVFRLVGHPQADKCFAWGHDDSGGEKIVAVLGVPPIDSSLAAVRAAIVAESQSKNR